MTTPAQQAMDPVDVAPRLYFLDWLRIAAFGLLVIYHVGMYYSSWRWHIKSPFAGDWLDPWMKLSSPWRMSLLFLISGAATAMMFNKAGVQQYSRVLLSRAGRLLLPLLAGVLLIVPPQPFFEVMQYHGFQGGFIDFMRLYLQAFGGFCTAARGCLILPTWNHLWFLPYLFLYTAVFAWLFRTTTWVRTAQASADPDKSVWFSGWRLLLTPVALLSLARMFVAPRFPITGALIDDGYAHLVYGSMFLLGAWLSCDRRIWRQFELLRWLALILALLAWLTLVLGGGHQLSALAHSTQQWCAIVAALGFAHRHLNLDSRLRVYLTEAVFPVYILHQTLIVLLAVFMAPFALLPRYEGPLLIVLTLVLAFAGFEGVRRVGCLRRWAGLAARDSERAPHITNQVSSTPRARSPENCARNVANEPASIASRISRISSR